MSIVFGRVHYKNKNIFKNYNWNGYTTKQFKYHFKAHFSLNNSLHDATITSRPLGIGAGHTLLG